MASVSALVTVGIVAFNHAEFIVDALESTLREESCRVIVADDASTDGTQGVVRKWLLGLSDQDAMRFTLVFNDDNVGLNATLNLVFAEVTTPTSSISRAMTGIWRVGSRARLNSWNPLVPFFHTETH
ncbi:glycosyltransferase [Ornithinimicrobium sp. INDO-MA30-4]|uniref:glycosyltransferase family 2 protein n=1 Tax=Ornithinimicrobium sp. INDO-MA30-4 TaxID=2908651 RepID=UPI001F3A7C7D|nr:glycosyltransferase [Ornithinimicrobium sp. INDO-MA30-4]UJH69904.1 glycosyltransferase [Ornithinimicrobium sp. INDO-MA30-4]